MKYPYYKISAIRELLEQGGAAPLKKWGQNFLINPGTVSSIIQSVPPEQLAKSDFIVEIGPGLGVLTYELVQFSKRYLVFEIDPFFSNLLRSNSWLSNKIELIEGDFLQTISKIPQGPFVAYGNLPYHISSEALILLLSKCHELQGGSFLVQKEFGERIANETSSLSVFVSAFGDWKVKKKVTPGNFFPPPKIDSVILQYIAYPDRQFSDKASIQTLSVFLKTIFWGKRKKISTSIHNAPFIQKESDKNTILGILESMNLSMDLRPEEIPKKDLVKVAAKISNVIQL